MASVDWDDGEDGYDPLIDGTPSPDEAAEARRLARDTGADPLVVQTSPDFFRRAYQQKLAREAPAATRAYLAKPANAAIAHDDVDALAGLEEALSAMPGVSRGAWLRRENARRAFDGAAPLSLNGRQRLDLGVKDGMDTIGVLTGASALARLLPGQAGQAAAESQDRGLDPLRRAGYSYQAGKVGQNLRLDSAVRIMQAAARGEEADPQDVARNEAYKVESRRLASMGLGEGYAGQLFSAVPSTIGSLVAGPQYAVSETERALKAFDAAPPQTRLPLDRAVVSTAAGAVGFAMGGPKFSSEMEAVNAFELYRTFKTTDGRPLDPKIAAEAAQLVGNINMGVEYFSGFAFGLGQKALSETRKRLMKEGGQAAIQRFAMTTVAARYGLAIAGATVTEPIEEGVQHLVTIREGERAKEIDARRYGGEYTPADWDKARADAWEQMLVAAPLGAVGGAVFAAPGLVADIQAAEQAERTRDRVLGIAEAARSSKLAKRDPEAFAEFVDSAAPDAEIYIDLDGATPLAQEMRLDDPGLARALGVTVEQVQDARAADGLLLLTPGQYAKAALTEIGPKLAPHIAFERGAPTFAQTEAAKAEVETRVQELMKEIQKQGAENEGTAAATKAIFDDVKAQLKDAKQAGASEYARMMASAVTTLATRAGTTPDALWQRIRPSIESYSDRATADRSFAEEFANAGARATGATMEQPQDMAAAPQAAPQTAPEGGSTFNQFADPEAEGVDLDQLRVARAMAAEGRDTLETGWVRDPAGQWWTLIPGRAAARADSRLLEERGATTTLGEILQWPELYQAYPFLAAIPVRAEYNGLASGTYSDADRTISIPPYKPPEGMVRVVGEEGLRPLIDERLKRVLIHELQHAIQHHRGEFGAGTPEWIGSNVDLNGLAKSPSDAYRRLRWEVAAFAAGEDLGLAELARTDQLAIVLKPESEWDNGKQYKLISANGAGVGGQMIDGRMRFPSEDGARAEYDRAPAPAPDAAAIAQALREAAQCAASQVAGAGAAAGGVAAAAGLPAGVTELMVGNAIGAVAAPIVTIPLASALGADNRKRIAEAYKQHLRKTAGFPLEEPAPPIAPVPGMPTASPSDPPPMNDGIAADGGDLVDRGFGWEERARRYYEPGDAE